MATFYVRETLKHPTNTKLVVMAGKVIDGPIEPGMIVHVPLNGSVDILAPIHSIEINQQTELDNVHLQIECEEDDEFDIWLGLNIGDEELKITHDDSTL